MERFKNIKSRAIPLPIDNIDTDQIIPARYLKAINREDFGSKLFYDWRFNEKGEPNNSFVLNNPVFSGFILIAGKNFGCGSSREHAAWALHDYGFKVIIASSFADIFKSNALNNGLLTIELPAEIVNFLLAITTAKPQSGLIVNLHNQSISIEDRKFSTSFIINEFHKECLLKGFDSIDYLINLRSKTELFERNRMNKLEYIFA